MITKRKSFKLQLKLDKILTILEPYLNDSDFEDACDSIATITTYIKSIEEDNNLLNDNIKNG